MLEEEQIYIKLKKYRKYDVNMQKLAVGSFEILKRYI